MANIVIIRDVGVQGPQGIRGADPELTALEQFTGSIQTQVNSLRAATSSYVQNAQTASMLQPYVLTSSTGSMTVRSAGTASRLEGIFSLTANSDANNRTISSIGGLSFNNNASIDQDNQRSLIFKTTPDGNVGSLSTRLTISGSGQVGINITPFSLASLTVSGGVILNGSSSYFQDYATWPVQLHSGRVNNGIGIYSDIVGQYGYGTSSPYYQFGQGGSATWRLATSTNQAFLIQNIQPGLNTRVYVSSSGYVGIGTSSPLSNLHVHKDPSGAPLLGLDDGITLTLENDTTNFINFRSPNAVAAGLAFTTPADNSAGYITLRQDTGEVYYSTENSSGYHRFIIGNTERLRVTNTGVIITGSSLLLGNQTITGSIRISGSVVFPNNFGGIYTTTTTGTEVQSFYIDQGNNLVHKATSGGDQYFVEGSNVVARFVNGGTINLGGTSATNNPTVRIPAAGGMIVTGSVRISGSNTLIGSTELTGSFSVSGSTLQTGNNTLIGNTILSGSIEVSGSSNFHNSSFTVTGSSNFKGDINFDGNVNVVYPSSFYHWGNKLFNYGAFSDTTSQSGSANTAYTMKFNTNDVVGYGVNIVSQSRITFEHTGLYNIQFSAQLERVAGSGHANVSVWLRVTGSDIANSCTDVALNGNSNQAASVAAWNFVYPMSASQYCELAWSTTDTNIHIIAQGTRTDPIRPAVPSVILTVTQVA